MGPIKKEIIMNVKKEALAKLIKMLGSTEIDKHRSRKEGPKEEPEDEAEPKDEKSDDDVCEACGQKKED